MEYSATGTTGLKQFLREFKDFVVVAAGMTFLLTCVFSINKVPSGSMEPTVKTGSYILNWRLPFFLSDPVPDHGDIIVFQSNDGGRLLLKRVIGLPGDHIALEYGYVYLNGEKLDEPYVKKQGTTSGTVTEYDVPEGSLFVLGDNREESKDSRYMANNYVPVSSVQARNIFIFNR